MSQIESIAHIRGDTYLLSCTYSIDGVDQPIDSAAITSRVRAVDGSQAWECQVTKGAPREDGHIYDFAVSAPPGASANAPLGWATSDIRYSWSDGHVDTTPIFRILITDSVTAALAALEAGP